VDDGSAAAAERRERATILESRSRARAPGRRKRCGLPPRWRAGERRRRSMDGGIEMGDLESSAGLAGDDLGLEGRGGGGILWWRAGAAVEGNENEAGRGGKEDDE
jgi:hypothetical protein